MKKKVSIWGYVFNLISLVSSLSLERFAAIYDEYDGRIGDGNWRILESRLFF